MAVRLAQITYGVRHELSKYAWTLVFGMARRSLACWIDGLD